jgi:hypothetical protein
MCFCDPRREVGAEVRGRGPITMTDANQEGAFLFYLLLGGFLTFALGILALVLFRRAVRRNMQGAVLADPPVAASGSRRPARAPLVLRVETLSAPPSGMGPSDRPLGRLAAAHAIAGLSFGTVAALLLLVLSGTEIAPLRFAAVAWSYTWPTVLVLALLVGPDRRTQAAIVLCYLGGLVILCLAAWLTGTPELNVGALFSIPGFLSPALIWGINALPSAFLLLFLNRAIRAIGPLVIVFTTVALLGSHVALSILAVESVMMGAAGLAADTGIGGHGVFWGVALLGLLAGSWPAWRCVVFLRDRYAAKRLSDLMLTIYAIWLLQTLVLASSLLREQGLIGVAAAFLALLAWRLALAAALRPVVAEARTRPACELLLLRVFGTGRRSRRLIDLLAARWRVLGSIDLIAGPDLASRTVEPAIFLEFLRGRLRRLFIRTPDDLANRLADLDRGPDPDGRFRVNQLFCSGEIWKTAVTTLMGKASFVVMDLRGFGPQRRGCVFELQTLLDTVDVSKLVLLVDATSDRGSLEQVLQERWRLLEAKSPNLASERAELVLYDVSARESRVVRTLLQAAQALPASNATGQTADEAARSRLMPIGP